MYCVVRCLWTFDLQEVHEYLHIDSQGICSWGPQVHMRLFKTESEAEEWVRKNHIIGYDSCYVDLTSDEDIIDSTAPDYPFAERDV